MSSDPAFTIFRHIWKWPQVSNGSRITLGYGWNPLIWSCSFTLSSESDQSCDTCRILLFLHHALFSPPLLIKAAFIWSEIQYNSEILLRFKMTVFCDAQLCFQHHSSSLQCHMIFRNHSNILSDDHPYWKQLSATEYLCGILMLEKNFISFMTF